MMSLYNTVREFSKKKVAIISSVFMALVVAIVLMVSGKATIATAGKEAVLEINAPDVTVTAQREHFAIPVKFNDGLTPTAQRSIPATQVGISKNPEVLLTEAQLEFVRKFDQYLVSIGKAAVVTSGERSPENQLGLIKDRIQERGAEDQFPGIEEASLTDTKVWLKAWQWLRSKRVPVYAPQEVPGVKVSVSNHLKGMAIDFAGANLDQINGWLVSFQKTSLGKSTDLKITTIAREPGCVHINLDNRA